MSKPWILSGLAIDIVGVGFLAYFGLPSSYLNRLSMWAFAQTSSEMWIQQLFSWFGVVLVLAGFVLQFVGNLRD